MEATAPRRTRLLLLKYRVPKKTGTGIHHYKAVVNVKRRKVGPHYMQAPHNDENGRNMTFTDGRAAVLKPHYNQDCYRDMVMR